MKAAGVNNYWHFGGSYGAMKLKPL